MNAKYLLIILVLICTTGCKRELICKKETNEEEYKLYQTLKFEVDKENYIKNSTFTYDMIFNDENLANSYISLFDLLKEDYSIKQDDNVITITGKNNYSEYKQTKKELKNEMKENGYSCK